MPAVSSSAALRAVSEKEGKRLSGWLPARPNLSNWERWISLAAGGLVTVAAWRRRSLAAAIAGGGLLARGATGYCPICQAVGIDSALDWRRLPWVSVRAGRGVRIDERIEIRRPIRDVFQFWQNFENLPRVMDHLQSVERLENGRSHWVAQGPLGVTVEWDAEIINQRPDRLLAWRSLPGGDLDTAGSVRFSPSPDRLATALRLQLKYDPPGGRLGARVAWLLGENPRRQIRHDLARLKDLLEGGNPLPVTPEADVRRKPR